jgi:serine/threonine protein kinase
MTTRPDIYYVFIFRCAPEFCAKRMLSSASDVWSYGIVMWEIFSGGREPNICKTDIVLKDIAMHIIEKGCRLEKPEKCSDSVYQLMQDCWKMAPEHRPDFTGLVKQLQ